MLIVFLQQAVNGIILGCIYALIALGLSLIFGILETANFAHGEFYMIGAFIGFFSTSLLGLPFFVSILVAMVGMGVLGVAIERAVFRPIVGKPLINSMLLSFGLSTALANLALFLFKADPRKIESGLNGISFDIFGVFLTAPSNEFPIKYSDGNWGDGQSSDQNVAYLMEVGGSRNVKTYQGFYDIKLDQKLDFITEGLSVQGALS